MQDATRKQIGVGDIVDIAAGRAKGKSGTVKFIHRQGLFLHVRWPFCYMHGGNGVGSQILAGLDHLRVLIKSS